MNSLILAIGIGYILGNDKARKDVIKVGKDLFGKGVDTINAFNKGGDSDVSTPPAE